MPGAPFQALMGGAHYLPAVNPTISGSNPPGHVASTGWVAFYADETAALTNNAVVVSIGAYCDAACTLTMKIVLRNSSTNVDVVVSQAGFSHPGGGWADMALTTPYTVPGLGSYYVGAFFNTNPSIKYNASDTYLTAVGNITGAGQTVSEGSSAGVPSFRATYG